MLHSLLLYSLYLFSGTSPVPAQPQERSHDAWTAAVVAGSPLSSPRVSASNETQLDQLDHPTGVLVHDHYLYVAEFHNDRVTRRKLPAAAAAGRPAGDAASREPFVELVLSSVDAPVGLAAAGRWLYVAVETGGHHIRRWDLLQIANEQLLSSDFPLLRNDTAELISTAPFALNRPHGLQLAGPNTLFVTDTGNHRVLSCSKLRAAPLTNRRKLGRPSLPAAIPFGRGK